MGKRFSPLGGNAAYVIGLVSPLFVPRLHDPNGREKVKECVKATKQGNARVAKEAKKAPKVIRRTTPMGARGLVIIGEMKHLFERKAKATHVDEDGQPSEIQREYKVIDQVAKVGYRYLDKITGKPLDVKGMSLEEFKARVRLA